MVFWLFGCESVGPIARVRGGPFVASLQSHAGHCVWSGNQETKAAPISAEVRMMSQMTINCCGCCRVTNGDALEGTGDRSALQLGEPQFAADQNSHDMRGSKDNYALQIKEMPEKFPKKCQIYYYKLIIRYVCCQFARSVPPDSTRDGDPFDVFSARHASDCLPVSNPVDQDWHHGE